MDLPGSLSVDSHVSPLLSTSANSLKKRNHSTLALSIWAPLSSSPTRSLWRLALQNATERLEEQDCAQIFLVKGPEDFIRILTGMQSRTQGKPLTRLLTRLEPFVATMRSFSIMISIFVSSDPMIAALIWGSFNVLIELTYRSIETLEKLISILNDIGTYLPRFDLYNRLFPDQKRLETALVQVYADIIEFFILGIKHFRRNTLVNVLRSVWSSFEAEYASIVSRLKLHGDHVEKEAFAAYVVTGERRHQELMNSLRPRSPATLESLQDKPCHFIRLSEPSTFKGRGDILDDLFTHLDPFTSKALPKRFVLTGIGGVGKTQVALRFAYDHLESYPAIFWVSAETEERLVQDFQSIAVALSLDESADSIRPQRAANLTLQWLKDTDIPWLLIFDNVEEFGLLQPYWPRTNKGSVLLTSRYPNLGKTINARTRLVEPFNQLDGANLLLSLTTSNEGDLDHAKEVSKRLGGLALGLAHVAGFMRESNCNFEDFHEIYEKRRDQIEVNSAATNQTMFQYERSLSTAWDLSFMALDANSRMLLDLSFFYDSDAIPESLFEKGAMLAEQTELEFLQSRSKYLTTISTLQQRSLIQRNAASKLVSVHRLVQLETCRSWSKEIHQNRFELAASLLANAFPPQHSGQPMTSSWSNCATLVPHVFTVSQHLKTDDFLKPSLEFVGLGIRCGWYLYERGLHSKSISILEQAEEICLRHHQDSLLLADVYRGLACNGKNLNRPIPAEAYARRTNQIRSHLLPEGHIQIANGLTDYGLILNCLDKMDEAIRAHSQAIAINESNRDCSQALLAQSYSCLGRVLTRVGQLDEASRLNETAVRIGAERSYIYLYHLGNVRLAQGELNNAVNLHVQALRIRREVLGHDAHYTGLSLHKVGVLRHMQAATQEAIALLKEALKIFESVQELEGDFARTSYKLGEILRECGDEQAASQYIESARAIRYKLCGIATFQAETYSEYDRLTAYDNR